MKKKKNSQEDWRDGEELEEEELINNCHLHFVCRKDEEFQWPAIKPAKIRSDNS